MNTNDQNMIIDIIENAKLAKIKYDSLFEERKNLYDLIEDLNIKINTQSEIINQSKTVIEVMIVEDCTPVEAMLKVDEYKKQRNVDYEDVPKAAYNPYYANAKVGY